MSMPLSMSSADARAWFSNAVDGFTASVAPVGDDQWQLPGLGEWTVRDLAGHASRAMITVEQYLAPEATEAPQLHDAVDYYLAAADLMNGPGVAQRGRDAAAAMGEDPVGYFVGLARRVLTLVHQTPTNVLCHTPFGTIGLPHYLTTRAFGLTVHSIDLSDALGQEPDPVIAHLVEPTLQLAASIAARRGMGLVGLRALTGRARLPEGYSAL